MWLIVRSDPAAGQAQEAKDASEDARIGIGGVRASESSTTHTSIFLSRLRDTTDNGPIPRQSASCSLSNGKGYANQIYRRTKC